MNVKAHPRVQKYLLELSREERERVKKKLRELGSDPYKPRPGVDIKRPKGRKHYLYRLRVGSHRFEYFVEERTVWIDGAFRRERGYRAK